LIFVGGFDRASWLVVVDVDVDGDGDGDGLPHRASASELRERG
jgi:hypothetical protein